MYRNITLEVLQIYTNTCRCGIFEWYTFNIYIMYLFDIHVFPLFETSISVWQRKSHKWTYRQTKSRFAHYIILVNMLSENCRKLYQYLFYDPLNSSLYMFVFIYYIVRKKYFYNHFFCHRMQFLWYFSLMYYYCILVVCVSVKWFFNCFEKSCRCFYFHVHVHSNQYGNCHFCILA